MFVKLESGVIINVKLIEVIESDHKGQQRARINLQSYIVTEKDIEQIVNPWYDNPFFVKMYAENILKNKKHIN